jgi:hypothetical protein
MFLTWTVVCLVVALASCYLAAAFPFFKHINATPVAIQGDTVTIKGTVDVYFSCQAWREFGYKNGNFPYFDHWWHQQIGNTYWYMGVHAKLVYIDWTLLQHYPDHDHLGYVMKIKVLSVGWR